MTSMENVTSVGGIRLAARGAVAGHRRAASLIGLIVMLAASTVSADSAFGNGDLRGAYGFSFDLTFATGQRIAAVGRFTADGAGTYTGERTVNLGTGSPDSPGVFHQSFSCMYSVDQNGTGTAVCSTPFGPERFAFVLVDEGKELQFISITPGISLRGVARRQAS